MSSSRKYIVFSFLIILLMVSLFFLMSSDNELQVGDVNTSPEKSLSTQQENYSESTEEISTAILDDIWPPLSKPMVGDLDKMLGKQQIRVLTTFSLGSYYIDRAEQRGTVYEFSKELEKFIKKKLGNKASKLHVIIIPVRRDQLIPYLVDGYGDVIIANLTITSKREELIDFSRPISKGNVHELLVTGPKSPAITSIEDLAGTEIAVREDSSFFETLQELNQRFVKEGKAEINISLVDPRLEREDILDMVNAGMLPMTVHDDHVLAIWSQIFTDLKIHKEMPLKEEGKIAYALRKNSPEFKSLINEFVDNNKQGTLIGNVILNRYFKDIKWAYSAMKNEPFREMDDLVLLFKKYGAQYDIDWVLLISFAYQESRFDQNAKSHVGAIGIMQVLPSTAADKLVSIPDISTPENNIHAGTKYISVLRDRYFSEENMDDFERYMFTMAAYNAGPNRINRLRKEAKERGLDPDKWFDNVEYIVASRVGQEPVVYVGNIFKYYVAYKRIINEFEARNQALGR
jgi:membrane-bound lytic murein transglycosylase MltF